MSHGVEALTLIGFDVKFYLTDGQNLRLLCMGGWCNLHIVRSIPPTENANDQPYLCHRARRAGASGDFSHGCFRGRFPAVADDMKAVAKLLELAPYAALELVLPGGSLMALGLWLYRRQRKVRQRGRRRPALAGQTGYASA